MLGKPNKRRKMRVQALYPNYYFPKIQFCGNRISPTTKQWNELKVISHHIEAYKKGLRNLILTTEKSANKEVIENRLQRENISYLIQDVDDKKINVFFGNQDSVEVIKSFNQPKLNKYTPEQDFILGTLLGYDKIQQCQRYLKMISKCL